MNKRSALYIGAGTDTMPMIHCKWIHDFICVDSQPDSMFGIQKSGRLTAEGRDTFYCPEFMGQLETVYNQLGLRETKHPSKPNVKVYANHLKRIIYYPNTAIPDHHFFLKDAIRKVDTLIVAGFDPDSIILNYVTKRLDFIGMEGTNYDAEENPSNQNSILQRLHNGSIQCYFKKYMYIKRNGEKSMFKLWDDFMRYYEDVTHYHPIVI